MKFAIVAADSVVLHARPGKYQEVYIRLAALKPDEALQITIEDVDQLKSARNAIHGHFKKQGESSPYAYVTDAGARTLTIVRQPSRKIPKK